MNKLRTTLFFIVSVILLFLLFFADILWGSVRIPIEEVFLQDSIYANIINNFRLPKAITAVVVGMSVAVSGLLMQTLFRNPLAGPYVLGVSSGASFGVAIYILVGGFLPVVFLQSGWGLIISAVVGAIFTICLLMRLYHFLIFIINLFLCKNTINNPKIKEIFTFIHKKNKSLKK